MTQNKQPETSPAELVYPGFYRTEHDALLAAASFEFDDGKQRHPYKCPCGSWHLA